MSHTPREVGATDTHLSLALPIIYQVLKRFTTEGMGLQANCAPAQECLQEAGNHQTNETGRPLHLQHVARARHHLVQNWIDEESDEEA
jgi:hypothetical protein